MAAIPYCPTQVGYAASFGEGMLRIALDGGAGRYRRVSEGNTHVVNARWVLEGQEFSVLQGLYRNFIRSGGAPLTVPLTLDSSTLDLYTVWILPQTWSLQERNGDIYTIVAQLEVEPLGKYWNGSEDDWGAVAVLVGVYGSVEAAARVLNLLDKLVNQDLPYYA